MAIALEELTQRKKVGINDVLGLDPANYTLLIVKPGAMARHDGEVIGAVRKIVADNGFKITHEYEGPLTEAHAREHYGVHSKKSFFGELVRGMTGKPVYACVIIGENARKLLRTTHAEKTSVLDMQKINPNSLRAIYGNPQNPVGDNAVHLSDLERVKWNGGEIETNKFEVQTAAKYLGWK